MHLRSQQGVALLHLCPEYAVALLHLCPESVDRIFEAACARMHLRSQQGVALLHLRPEPADRAFKAALTPGDALAEPARRAEHGRAEGDRRPDDRYQSLIHPHLPSAIRFPRPVPAGPAARCHRAAHRVPALSHVLHRRPSTSLDGSSRATASLQAQHSTNRGGGRSRAFAELDQRPAASCAAAASGSFRTPLRQPVAQHGLPASREELGEAQRLHVTP